MKEYLNKIAKDLHTGKEETVIDATENSIHMTQTKLKDEGINCSQWFTDKDFEKQFRVL